MAYYAQSAIADERDVSTAVAYAGLYRWGNPRTVALSMAEYAAEVQAHRRATRGLGADEMACLNRARALEDHVVSKARLWGSLRGLGPVLPLQALLAACTLTERPLNRRLRSGQHPSPAKPIDARPTKRPSDSRTSKTSEDSRQCGEVRMARRTRAGGAGHGLGPTDPPNDRRVIRRKFRT